VFRSPLSSRVFIKTFVTTCSRFGRARRKLQQLMCVKRKQIVATRIKKMLVVSYVQDSFVESGQWIILLGQEQPECADPVLDTFCKD
jgi:hypothetical protein